MEYVLGKLRRSQFRAWCFLCCYTQPSQKEHAYFCCQDSNLRSEVLKAAAVLPLLITHYYHSSPDTVLWLQICIGNKS